MSYPILDADFKAALDLADISRKMDEGLLSDNGSQRWAVALNAVPGFMAQLIRVPIAYWMRVYEGENGEIHLARVKCPCGEAPLVEEGTRRECECQRSYIYLGRDKLYVTNSPKQRAQARWERIVEDWRS